MAGTELPTMTDGGRKVPRWLWPVARQVLLAAVLAAVGWQFATILRKPELWERPLPLHPGWLGTAAILYLVGLAFPAVFWHRLLGWLGQRPRLGSTLRAYYVGQLGRYIPGKVIALGIRVKLLAGPGIAPDIALLAVIYEVLSTIASGLLLGMGLLAVLAPFHKALGWRALALLAVVGGLLLPGAFNRLAARASRRFRATDAPPLPRVRASMLATGLAVGACGWLVQGGTLWAVVHDLAPDAWPDPIVAWGCCTAYIALAYVAGFLVLAAPGGLGVRDLLIQQFLAADLGRTMGPERAAAIAVLAALFLRLLWTVLDVAAAAVCYWLPERSRAFGNGSFTLENPEVTL